VPDPTHWQLQHTPSCLRSELQLTVMATLALALTLILTEVGNLQLNCKRRNVFRRLFEEADSLSLSRGSPWLLHWVQSFGASVLFWRAAAGCPFRAAGRYRLLSGTLMTTSLAYRVAGGSLRA
jgi:hypothetical protein